jgi:hypothetical protein
MDAPFPLPEIQEREQLRQDIKRSGDLRAEIRARIARGKFQDIATAWDVVETLDTDIGRRIRLLTPDELQIVECW